MGSIRFRKQIKLFPGLKLNINAKSIGLTAGVRGAHVTVNSKGQRTVSAGLPGTGLSYRDTKTMKRKAPTVTPAEYQQQRADAWEQLVNAILLYAEARRGGEDSPESEAWLASVVDAAARLTSLDGITADAQQVQSHAYRYAIAALKAIVERNGQDEYLTAFCETAIKEFTGRDAA